MNLKTIRTKCQLHPCQSQQNLLHMEHVGSWHYLWFHGRMPGGTIGGFTEGFQQGTKNTSHWDNISLTLPVDINLLESLQHHKLLSSLIDTFCTWADSELMPSTTQPNSTNLNKETVGPLEKNTLSNDDPYPRKIWFFNRGVNIIYQVTSIKYCIESNALRASK